MSAGHNAPGPVDRGKRWWAPSKGPLIVMYHGIGGRDGVSLDNFRAQLDALTLRRSVVSLAEAVGMLGSSEAIAVASITFDDAYRDFAELALPEMRARGLHSTVFVPGARIGGSNEWDRGFAAERAILNANELRDLDSAWVEIGVHGLSHRRMAGLDSETLIEETAVARAKVEEACQRTTRLFAYPYGQLDDFDEAAEQAVAAAGFQAACSTCYGRGSSPEERFRLRRVGIVSDDEIQTVERKFDGAYDWIAWKERIGARLRSVRRPAPAPKE